MSEAAMKAPVEGDAYWLFVRQKPLKDGTTKEYWLIGFRDSHAAGGWTNGDCWEDFRDEVVRWVHIPGPAQLAAPERRVSDV